MSHTTLIADGTVVTADDEFAGDVLIEGEKIAAVGRVGAPEGTDVVDATGCFVLPGLIDNHTHLSMPFMGMMSSDDYDTGTRAAAAGGTTCLVDFAIQRQPDNLALGARGVARSRRRRRPRGLRLPHGDHERQRPGPRGHDRDGRGRRLLVQAVHGLQGRADGSRRRAHRVHGARARPGCADDGACRERRHRRPARQARARARATHRRSTMR